MEQTECSETSAYELQAPGNYPKESIQPRTCCRSLFKHASITFIIELPLSIMRKIFKHIYLYAILIQGTSTIFIDQMPTYHVFKKSAFYAGIKIFNSLPPSLTILDKVKVKFEAA